MTDMVVNLLLKDGHLFIPAAAYRDAMVDLLAVAVLWRSPCLHLIPLHPGTIGGFLLKQRNLAGDRVVDLRLFLRDHELAENVEGVLSFAWIPEQGSWQTTQLCPELFDK
ncbi:MAG: hypothetical protein ACYDDP_05400 [Acidithiobacillus sp.]